MRAGLRYKRTTRGRPGQTLGHVTYENSPEVIHVQHGCAPRSDLGATGAILVLLNAKSAIIIEQYKRFFHVELQLRYDFFELIQSIDIGFQHPKRLNHAFHLVRQHQQRYVVGHVALPK